jgi:hypothetical protein
MKIPQYKATMFKNSYKQISATCGVKKGKNKMAATAIPQNVFLFKTEIL